MTGRPPQSAPTSLPPFLAPRPAPEDPLPPRPDPDALLRTQRARQITFERGAALALVGSMLDHLGNLRQLSAGTRWVVEEHDLAAFERWLTRLHEDILRTHRAERPEMGS